MGLKQFSRYKKKNMKYAMIKKGPIVLIIALRNSSSKTKRKTKKYRNRIRRGGASTNDKKTSILNLATDTSVISTVKEKNKDKQTEYEELLKEIRKNPDFYAESLPDEVYAQIQQKSKSEEAESKSKTPEEYQKYLDSKPMKLELLLQFLLNNKKGRSTISDALAKLESDRLITPQQKSKILATLDNKDPSTITKIGQGTVNAIKSSATALGNWFAPPLEEGDKANPNQSTVQILWMPRTNTRYKKTPGAQLPVGLDGKKIDESAPEYGDFMVYVDKDKYTSTWESLKKQFNGVDDIFANILNAISGADSVRTTPIRKKTIVITDGEPEVNRQKIQDAYNSEKNKYQEKQKSDMAAIEGMYNK